ncbi:HNH endonuclease signature motif containing protein, partial [Blastococcus sp. TF02A-30]|uniref:HNH endonuclease signature motif containing protein n=1 Tax=Blastococcus sp. TF02A-30 TaxID=2250580 RepID=UPI000DFFC092
DRPIGVLRGEAHAALVLNPGGADGAGFTGHVTVLAPLPALTGGGARAAAADPVGAGRSGAAGECGPAVGGQPITAAHLRELLAQLGGLGLQAPPGGSLAVAITDEHGALLATATPAELARLAASGCRAHGREAACACPQLGAPADRNGYAPAAAQERFVRLRDRTCRHPGCARPAGRTDLDHVVPHDCGGRTGCDNLCCLCRTHHRLKTFARGWRFALAPDGTLTVTTPSGITRSTRPPGLRDRPALPPPPAPPPDHTPPPF